jgi:hypothetical protein
MRVMMLLGLFCCGCVRPMPFVKPTAMGTEQERQGVFDAYKVEPSWDRQGLTIGGGRYSGFRTVSPEFAEKYMAASGDPGSAAMLAKFKPYRWAYWGLGIAGLVAFELLQPAITPGGSRGLQVGSFAGCLGLGAIVNACGIHWVGVPAASSFNQYLERSLDLHPAGESPATGLEGSK